MAAQGAEDLFVGEESKDLQLLGAETGFPFIYSSAFHTSTGTSYLKAPGVALISKPQVNLSAVEPFLADFDPALGFREYLNDPTPLDDGAQLMKFAGQLCYASFGPKRSWNADASKYFTNIKSSAHGSVCEHANYTLFIYGISRSTSHELVRHRQSGFSMLSQRYVNGSVLRFVERPEYQNDSELHAMFEGRIDRAANEYEEMAQKLLKRQKEGVVGLTSERKTDLRKKVQQTARSLLPNETETFLVMTANTRSCRHMAEMRASSYADSEIRMLFDRAFLCLKEVAPIIFDDYTMKTLDDGTFEVETPYRKI